MSWSTGSAIGRDGQTDPLHSSYYEILAQAHDMLV